MKLNVLLDKIKEVLYSILPITIIVLLLHFTLTPLSTLVLVRFLIGAMMIVLGLSIFLFGIEIGITPLGNNIGKAISKTNKIRVIVIVGFILGFFISIAEPDLQILANQVSTVTANAVTSMQLLIIVSIGIAAMLVLGLLRIVYNAPLHIILTIIYGIILILSFFVSPGFLAISFDASGATTGALTVPFILSLSMGISVMKKDSVASEKDSFGLVAIASTGAILAVLLQGVFMDMSGLNELPANEAAKSTSLLGPFISNFKHVAWESFVAILPIIIIFLFFQLKFFHLKFKKFKKILKGLLYTLIGLILFLAGVNAGFMDVGVAIGEQIANYPLYVIVLIAFSLGFVTILAEPAVHVLTDQIETVTSGFVKKRIVLAALTIGVGSAVALSMVRICIPAIQLWHILLPGYIISVVLSFIVPKLYVGIAFDSGGVASGPMTATFILAFSQGVANATQGADLLNDAFGMIALVAMTPIITLQLLGLIVKVKSRKKEAK